MYCRQCGNPVQEGTNFCPQCGASQESSPPLVQKAVAVVPAHAEGVVYAGFWRRVVAMVLDMIISSLAALIVVVPLAFILGVSIAGTTMAPHAKGLGQILGNVVSIALSWLYFTLMESSAWQATLGKRMLRIKVTDENGARIGFGRANGRYWSKILSTLLLCIGYIMVAFTKKKQGLHDKIAKTLVCMN
jgi:uncharacterized RDD family membrane protein YckC